MQRKLDINKSIYFYIVFGMFLFIGSQVMHFVFNNKAQPISSSQCLQKQDDAQQLKRPSAVVQQVPDEVRKKFSEKAVEKYEAAAQSGMSVASYVENEFLTEEAVLWQEIETHTGISHEDVLELKEECKKKYLEKNGKLGVISPKLSEKSILLAQEAMKDFNVDPSAIALEAGRNTLICADTMTINQKEHLGVPADVAKAIIGHEMIHYLLDDCYILQALQCYLKDDGVDISRCGYKHPYYKLRRFQELRADVLPALKDMTYAYSSVECLKIMLQESGDGGFLSHPKTSFRLKEVKAVYDALRLEQVLNQQPLSL